MSNGAIKVIFDCNVLARFTELSMEDYRRAVSIIRDKYSYYQTPHLTAEMSGVALSNNTEMLHRYCRFLMQITSKNRRLLKSCNDIARNQLKGDVTIYEEDGECMKWERFVSEPVLWNYTYARRYANEILNKKESQKQYLEEIILELRKGNDPIGVFIDISAADNMVFSNKRIVDDFAKSHQRAPRGAPKLMTHTVSH